MFRERMERGDGKGSLMRWKERTTLLSILLEDRRWFAEQEEEAPAQFDRLVQWLREHGAATGE